MRDRLAPTTDDLHPQTRRLLDRRGFIRKAGAGAAFTFLGMAVIGCSTDDEDDATATTGTGSATSTAPPTSPDPNSLYVRLGGNEGIDAVVGAFLAKVAADDRINRFFQNSDVAALQGKVVALVGQSTGGTEVYTGKNMQEAHAGFVITVDDFNAFVEDLVSTMTEAGVPEAEQTELLDLLAPMQSDIVNA